MEEKTEQDGYNEDVRRVGERIAGRLAKWASDYPDSGQWALDFLLKKTCRDGDNFNAQLLRLIDKADIHNQAHLTRAFPCPMALWNLWFRSENESIFLDELSKFVLKGGKN